MQDSEATPPETIPEMSRYTTISVAEAASRLGVTQDAVRKRLQRGTLAGIKTGLSWDVIETDELKDATPPETPDDQDTVAGRPDDVPVVSDSVLVDHLHAEIADLRARLDWAQANVDAKDRLLADVLADLARQRERTDVLQAQYHQADERIRQLEAGEPPESGETAEEVSASAHHDEDSMPPASLWARLQRWWRG